MKKTLLFVFAAFCLLFFGCSAQKKYTEYEYGSFDTVTSFTVYNESADNFNKYKEYVFSELERYDALFDIYEPHDGVYGLYELNRDENRTEGVAVANEIYELLTECKKAYDYTSGRVNCAMGAVLNEWHKARETGVLPDMDNLEYLNAFGQIGELYLEDGYVRFGNSVMTLDVGAVAKGFACEKISEGLKQKGCKAFVLSMGGNVVTYGERDYKIGVRSSDGVSLSSVLLSKNEAVVTSGGYIRNAEIDGKSYHHIIDVKTLMPSDTLKSVTVMCPSSVYADALSTALFQMEPQDALLTAERLDVKVVIEDNSGNILYSEGVRYQK